MQRRNFESEFTLLVLNDQDIRASQICESLKLAFFKREEGRKRGNEVKCDV